MMASHLLADLTFNQFQPNKASMFWKLEKLSERYPTVWIHVLAQLYSDLSYGRLLHPPGAKFPVVEGLTGPCRQYLW
jgi:hypothetical protein